MREDGIRRERYWRERTPGRNGTDDQFPDSKLARAGDLSPKLIADVIALFSLERYLFPPETFCPLRYQDWQRLIEPNLDSAAYRDLLWYSPLERDMAA